MPLTRASTGRSKKRLYTCPRLGLIRPAIVEEAAILDAIVMLRRAAQEQERASRSIPPAAEQPEKEESAVAPVNAMYE